jgi:hypothetical protein
VTPGTETFRWVYVKNGSASGGADKAWLDNIYLPSEMSLTIWAGPDAEVCAGEPFNNPDAYGTDYVSAEWVTSGSGTFGNNTLVNTIYTPSQEDINNGQVTLTLSLWNDESDMVEDELILSFKYGPEAPPAPTGPDYVDLLVTTTSDYTTEGIPGLDNYAWYISPADAGVIEGTTATATVTWNPDYLGTAQIFTAAINECGEGVKSLGFEVTVDNTVAVQENPADEFSATVSPNPGSGLFDLTLLGNKSENVNLKVTNCLGVQVFSKMVNTAGTAHVTLNLRSLPDGLYFLVLEGNDDLFCTKLVIRN